jgi:FKBP-type peptidyl-prolyl cis-trans isomerase FklB
MQFVPLLFLGAMLLSPDAATSERPTLRDPADRAGYSLGHQIGRDLKLHRAQVDTDALRRGLLDAMAGAEPAIDPQEMQRVLAEIKRGLLAAEREREREATARRREQGERFLAENSKKKEVVTLKSGLQYEVLQRGKGAKPGSADKVLVYYRGTTIDGHVFHDSRKRPGEPESLHVSGVIGGMTEALQLMKEGARWRLFVPANLAYGRRGPLADQVVIFEMELVAIEPRQ